MKRIKNIFKYLILVNFLVALHFISQSRIESNNFINLNWQDTSKIKPFDTLQNELNNYNKIACQNDSLQNKKRKSEELLELQKEELASIKQKIDLIIQEQKCEEIDSCKKILKKTKDSLTHRKLSIEDDISSLNKNLKGVKRDSIDLHKKQEFQIAKVQNKTSVISGSRKINFRGSWYYIFIVNTDSCQILMHHKDSLKRIYKTIDNVYKELKRKGLEPLMITNAGMYTQTFEPEGLFIEKNKELYSIDTTRPNNNNFYLKPNGVFYIDSVEKPCISSTEDFIKKYKSKKIKIKFATQSGPMLLINGKIHPAFTVNSTNRKIRSGVGICDDKKVVFAISLDEVNFYDFANLFKVIYGCKDALFLDGAISRMYLYDKAPQERGGYFGPMISIVKRKK